MEVLQQSIMNVARQQSIRGVVERSGIGLLTGQRTTVRLCPADPDTGIVFVRTDIENAAGSPVTVPVRWERAVRLRWCTGIENEAGIKVRTCEHLLAALYACQVDNVVIELSGEEVPILDGSAVEFVSLIRSADVVEQSAPRRYIAVRQDMEVHGNNRSIRIEPADELSIDITVPLPGFGTLRWSGVMTPKIFVATIARARTYTSLRNAILGKSLSIFFGKNFGRGGSLRNVCVYSHGRILNPGGLRMPDEMVKHRVLDLIGDLMLAGAPLFGKITAFRPSHSINQQLVRCLMSDTAAWRLLTRPMFLSPR